MLCLDSGAGIHVLTPDAATRLGIYPTNTGDRPVTGTAATVKARPLKLTNLTLGSTALADTEGVMVALPASLGGDGLLVDPVPRGQRQVAHEGSSPWFATDQPGSLQLGVDPGRGRHRDALLRREVAVGGQAGPGDQSPGPDVGGHLVDEGPVAGRGHPRLYA